MNPVREVSGHGRDHLTPELAGRLKAYLDGGLPGYGVKYLLTRGETHTTSLFTTLPAALRFIYGAK